MNNDLADTFGNLVNRTLAFLVARYDGVVPHAGEAAEPEERLKTELEHRLDALHAHHDALAFRKAADEVRSIWRLANGYLAAQAPWSLIGKDAVRAAVIVRTGVNLVAISATVAVPFIPETAENVLKALDASDTPTWPPSLTGLKGGQAVKVPDLLFTKLTPEWVKERQQQFSGN